MQEPFGGLPSVSIIDLGDSRHGTPSRPPLPVRNHTPPRSASNPRNSNSALRRALASALGSEQLNQAILAAEADGDLENSKDELYGYLRIEWRSAFSELFEARNADVLETFRQCAEHLSTQNHRPSKIYASQSEEAWHRVNKRLRKLVVGCLAESPAHLFPYLGALEDVLTHFCQHKELKPHDNDSKLADEYLAAKMHVDDQKVLHVYVRDFKGNRYLLHAVCQFYHLQSKVRAWA
ncbi:hypothetical protein EON65_29720 [archaeon]|nr:MAG: hypothetical protein EON65_29720 [archaeon]